MTETPAYSRVLRHAPEELADSLSATSDVPFWLDSPRPKKHPELVGEHTADLLVVGGGFCGLWTALLAKERNPERDVILIEGKRIAWAASGRNGGFVESSLTHGDDNGQRHFSSELDAIEKLAAQNFDEMRAAIVRYGIDAEWEESGFLLVATEPHQVDELRSSGGHVLEGEELRTVTTSPVVRAATMHKDGFALVHPAKLALGLLDACIALGVRVFEGTPATDISNSGRTVSVTTPAGKVSARRVALATNGFPSLLKRNSLFTLPVYDYVLVTEPLTDSQLASIGWTERYGISDSSRQFHYYRKTADNRILWGGYDVIYHRGRKIKPEYDQRYETFERLADHFFTAHPSLRGIKFSHAWGGMIDMSTKFVAFQGLAMGGKVSYSAGYTGLGVGSTRFGASVMLDLLAGEKTARTELKFPVTKPFPIPPEPIAYPAVQMMRNAIVKSDENGGKDGVLIRGMELFGIGFDS